MFKNQQFTLIILFWTILFQSCHKEEVLKSKYQTLAPKNATQVQLKIFNDLLTNNAHSKILDTVESLGEIAWEKASIMISSDNRSPVHLILPIKNKHSGYKELMDLSFSPERTLHKVRIVKEESIITNGKVNKTKIVNQRLFSQISGKNTNVSPDIISTVESANKNLYFYDQLGNVKPMDGIPNKVSNSSFNCEITLDWNAYIQYTHPQYSDPYNNLMYQVEQHMRNFFNSLGIFHDFSFPTDFVPGRLKIRENIEPNEVGKILKDAILDAIRRVNGYTPYNLNLTQLQYFGYGNCSPEWGGGTGGAYYPPTTEAGAPSTAPEEETGFDETEWENFSITYPSQALPTWQKLYQSYPHNYNQDLPASQVYNLVGGEVNSLYLSNPTKYGNACALRVSRALLYSGINIPNNAHTYKGADNKYYFLSSGHLFTFMKQTFGSGVTVHASAFNSNFSNWHDVLGSQRAIYIMRPNYPARFGALGHATLYDGSDCFNSSNNHDGKYLNPDGGLYNITLWRVN